MLRMRDAFWTTRTARLMYFNFLLAAGHRNQSVCPRKDPEPSLRTLPPSGSKLLVFLQVYYIYSLFKLHVSVNHQELFSIKKLCLWVLLLGIIVVTPEAKLHVTTTFKVEPWPPQSRSEPSGPVRTSETSPLSDELFTFNTEMISSNKRHDI